MPVYQFDSELSAIAKNFQADIHLLCRQNQIVPDQFYLRYPDPEFSPSLSVYPWLTRPLTYLDRPFYIANFLKQGSLDSAFKMLGFPLPESPPLLSSGSTGTLIEIILEHSRNRRRQWDEFAIQLQSYLPPDFFSYWVNYLVSNHSHQTGIIEQEKQDSLYFSSLDHIPLHTLRSAFLSTYHLIRQLAVRKFNEISGDSIRTIQTDQGVICIGTPGADHFQGDFFLILDPGGNDRYDMKLEVSPGMNRYILDFGGNDTYTGLADFSLGFAFLSEQLILDYQGNDSYLGQNFGLASGIAGNSFLIDCQGNDRYRSEGFSLAFSMLGHALLWDWDGEDEYGGGIFSQATALPAGFSLLKDDKGSDRYECISTLADIRDQQSRDSYAQAFAMGIRPYCAGGIAILQDLAGNDLYRGDYFCQGCGFWQGWAMLWDEAGDDRYLSVRYAQGCGVHQAVGILLDMDGNDRYQSWGVAQGCGYDYSLGILGDIRGHDLYQSTWYSMACGTQNGLGILSDPSGEDRFLAQDSSCLAYADTARATCSLALLVSTRQACLPRNNLLQERKLGFFYFK